MYRFNSNLQNKFKDFKNKLGRPETDYWKERLFGTNKFTWKSLWNLALRFAVWFVVFFILLFAWFAPYLPTPGAIKQNASAAPAQISDRNGKPIYALYGGQKRFDLTFQDIPNNIKQATITAEDRGFYHEFGISVKGIIRSAFNDIFHRSGVVAGGSTITQQYVKNALLDPKKTLTRKIKEFILTIEISAMYPKDKILTLYLNQIPYGNNSYGVQAAAKTYFGKNAKDLDLAEAATLAALPQRPTYFSPYGTHPDDRIARTNWILDGMVGQSYITKEEANKAKEEVKNLKFDAPNQYISAPHFVEYVKEQLIDKYGEQLVDQGGLRVTTTLDLDKQNIGETVLKDAQERLKNIKATNAALVSIDPKTGEILSMVGSIDYFNNDIDGQVNVADAARQPGSSFKPIVYATAFKKQYNPAFTLWDVTTNFGGYTPTNYDGATHGPVSIRSALALSLNIPAVKTLYLAGVSNALETAHDMGITTLNNSPDSYGLSLVLGSGEVKLDEHTAAYSVFANGGKQVPMISILKVVDSKGRVLEDNTKNNEKGKQVLDPQIAYEISSILSDNGARAPEFGSNSPLYFSDRPVAAKTGTTSSFRDAWTMGYTPSVATGVWVGNNDNTEMVAGSAGAMAAAPLWHSYMAQVLKDTPVETFQQPDGIATVTVDKLSNKLPTANSPETVSDIFAKWQFPIGKDDIHQSIRIDKATGLRATPDCPDALTENKIFTLVHSEEPSNPAWENPVRAVAQELGININFPSEQTSCTGSGNVMGIKFTAPKSTTNIKPSFSVIVTVKSKTVKQIELVIDNQSVSIDTSAPYTFGVTNLSPGKHKLTAFATEKSGGIDSESINVTVAGAVADTTAPGNVSAVSIVAGASSATVNWKNPADSDLKTINFYGSETQGGLGTLINSTSVNPSENSTINIAGLTSGSTYWLTLRAVDSAGNENNDSNQFEVTVL